MISFSKAIEQILSSVPSPSVEQTSLENAAGRILASDVFSAEALPPFNNSAMDGFAMRSQSLQSQSTPFKLRVNGIIAAGDAVSDKHATGPQECWEIMTGAVVPPSCDSVLKVEETQRKDDIIEFSRPTRQGENVRLSGEDFQVGALVAKSGDRIYPEHQMAMAALGIEEVGVVRRPTVAVISTGSELSADSSAHTGKIRNSSAPFLISELKALGVDAYFLGVIGDDPAEFITLMEGEIAKKVDVVISTGAVSMGRYDFIAPALKDLRADILFHKVAIRPGKPVLFAKAGTTAFFGLPGNPISTAVGLRFFVEPYLRTLQGLPPEAPYRAVLETPTKKPEGLRCFLKATVSHSNKTRTVQLSTQQESFRIAPLLTSNAWAVLAEDGNQAESEIEIDVYPLHSWTTKEALL